MTNTNEHCINYCNKLLRGERSAVETYDQAIEKYADDPALSELRSIRADHISAVGDLENNVRSMGGVPEEGSGAWGTFATLVQGAANLFGDDSAVAALTTGEKNGKKDYENGLEDEDIMPECKMLYRAELLKINGHIVTLDRLQERI